LQVDTAIESATLVEQSIPVKSPLTRLTRNSPKSGQSSAIWEQTRSLGTPPVTVRASDLRERNGYEIGRRVDAAEDGRAPGAVAFSSALQERGDSSPHQTGERSGVGFA